AAGGDLALGDLTGLVPPAGVPRGREAEFAGADAAAPLAERVALAEALGVDERAVVLGDLQREQRGVVGVLAQARARHPDEAPVVALQADVGGAERRAARDPHGRAV